MGLHINRRKAGGEGGGEEYIEVSAVAASSAISRFSFCFFFALFSFSFSILFSLSSRPLPGPAFPGLEHSLLSIHLACVRSFFFFFIFFLFIDFHDGALISAHPYARLNEF